MDNHVYQFDNKVRVETKGGPIGPIYTRFKDDIEVAIEALEKGSQLGNDIIEIDAKKKEEDMDKTDTKVTMEIVQKIANSINPMINLL